MKLATCLLVATAAPSVAQESVLAVRHSGTDFDLFEVELAAGLVLESDGAPLQPSTPFPIQIVWCVARVGSETWIGNSDGVLRYGGSPPTYLGRFAQGVATSRIVPHEQGAYVQFDVAGTVHEVDASGSTIRTIQTPSYLNDLAAYEDGYLAIFGDRIYRTSLDLDVLSEFAPGLAAQVDQSIGLSFTPRRVAVLSDGRIAFASNSFVVVASASGSLVSTLQAGLYESGVFETGGGTVLVPASSGASLLDIDSRRTFVSTPGLGGSAGATMSPPFRSTSPPSSGRACSAEPNSTGSAARLHLSAHTGISSDWLHTAVTDIPARTFTIPIYGTAAYDAPFGDGRLCVSPFSPGLTRGPVKQASFIGDVEQRFDFATPGLGAAFTAGSTWYFQVLYRDAGGSGFNGTDGVFLTFTP